MFLIFDMEILQKVKLLGDAGKWDTCASSASPRKVTGKDRIGNVASGGICHSFTENGRCISLFKTLMTNNCSFDCKYCQNSSYCKSQRKTIYEPEELAKVFMHLYARNYVEGLFLSSAVVKDPDFTMQKMIDSVNLIRNRYKFRGYIHLKIIPGASRDLIRQARDFSDRLSINLEAPNKSRLAEVSDVKDFKVDILRRQAWIKHDSPAAGQTTQLVVGGSDETDLEILRTVNWEYDNIALKRAYYSAFTPIEHTPLEFKDKTPYEREHRLYNVDFMIRKYDIPLSEFRDILVDDNLPKGDPKVYLARNFFDSPIDVNTATEEELLRVPGIGPLSCERIVSMQKSRTMITRREQLYSIGVVLKRAEPFLRIDGYTQKTLEAY